MDYFGFMNVKKNVTPAANNYILKAMHQLHLLENHGICNKVNDLHVRFANANTCFRLPKSYFLLVSYT